MLTILLVTANSRNAAPDLEYEHRLIVRAVREGGDASITVEALHIRTGSCRRGFLPRRAVLRFQEDCPEQALRSRLHLWTANPTQQ